MLTGYDKYPLIEYARSILIVMVLREWKCGRCSAFLIMCTNNKFESIKYRKTVSIIAISRTIET